MNTTDILRTEPRALRILHLLARVVLSFLFIFFLYLALLVPAKALREVVVASLGIGDPAKANPGIMITLLLGHIILAGALTWLGRRVSWRALAGLGAVVLAVLVYLKADDASVHRLQSIEEIVPLPPDAGASYAVLIRYGKRHPAGRDFKSPALRWSAFDPERPEPWIEFVTSHRAEIEAEWEELTPVRRWWTELNAFGQIADLMPPRLDGEILAFSPVRALAQRGCAIATLQALDGRGDAALETVLPLLEVSRKLQETGRSLVIQMVAIVVERMAMQTASFTLDRAPVSPALRTRLVAVLSRPGGGEAGARRLVAIERVLGQNTILNSGLDEAIEQEADKHSMRWVIVAMDPFIYNRRASANLLGGFLTEAEDLIGRRLLPEYDDRAQRFMEVDARPRFKNLGGRLLAVSAVPAYKKVANSYWKIQDERAALLAKIGALPPATP